MADASTDGGFQCLQQASALRAQILDPAPDASLCRKVSKRIARAASCGVEVVGDSLVLLGDEDACTCARLLLDWTNEQKGDALAELRPREANGLDTAELTEAEVKALSESILEQVEQEATVYLFLRDDHSEQQYKSGERIEFLWTDGGKEPGKWCEATFVRKSVGDGDEVKIRYQHEQRDIECTAKLRQVRPEESKRSPPGIYVYSRAAACGGRAGLAVAERKLKALLRDAVGKASTGQSWFRDKGKGVGKEGKGKASKPCFNFQKGFCDRDNCLYSHDVALAGEKGSKGAPGKGSWRQESSDRNKSWKQNQDDQSGQRQQSWQQKDDWRKGEWKSSHDSNKSNWKQDWGQNRKEWEARQDWQNRQQNSGKSNETWSSWTAPAEPPGPPHPPIQHQIEALRQNNLDLVAKNSPAWQSLSPDQIPTTVAMWRRRQNEFFPDAKELPEPWIRTLSKTSRKMYFTNTQDLSSTYDIASCF
ncbi:unnamed protein product [Effrenium voratum]|uniref:C3H1-type domain-containing protein n=1 Tax=Effrenium voratum TaxID=2562239 RepID=A0AA36NHE3_9DINO|nr:unnamed protein product [Effrenium voratum]CAJ1458913.1 unnamed protein product [Effrenium voratum]